MTPNGENGGQILRAIKINGVKITSGTMISADTARSWPLKNRRALATSGKVRWFESEKKEEAQIRPSQPNSKHDVQRIKVHVGFGKYHIVEGRTLTDAPVDKATAEAMIKE